jgi:hypothetical protein
MSVSAKALKYTVRSDPGAPLNFIVEEKKLPSPSNKQALVRFLAAAMSPSDFRVMHNTALTASKGDKGGSTREVSKRFLKATVCKSHSFPVPNLPSNLCLT